MQSSVTQGQDFSFYFAVFVLVVVVGVLGVWKIRKNKNIHQNPEKSREGLGDDFEILDY